MLVKSNERDADAPEIAVVLFGRGFQYPSEIMARTRAEKCRMSWRTARLFPPFVLKPVGLERFDSRHPKSGVRRVPRGVDNIAAATMSETISASATSSERFYLVQ